MNEVIEVMFNRLMLEIERFEPRSREALLPGATTNEISSFEKTIGLTLPKEVVDIYSITKGIDQEMQSENPVKVVFPGYFSFYIMDFDEIGFTMNEFLNSSYVAESDISRFFPMFTDGAGNYMCLDLSMSNQIVQFQDDDESIYESRVMFGSLQSMIECIIQFYQSGGFYFDDRGNIAANTVLLREIGLHREGTDFWK